MSGCRKLFLAGFLASFVVLACAPAMAFGHSFGSRVLKQNMAGEDVKVLQGYLSQLGVGTRVDGKFSGNTKAKVMAWERMAGRPVNGVICDRDAKFLRDAIARAQKGRAGGAGVPTKRAAKVKAAVGSSVRTVAKKVDQRVAVAAKTAGGATPTTIIPPTPARFGRGGTLIPHSTAPTAIKKGVAGANQMHHLPYRYGGGHARVIDTAYDCSGSVSRLLIAAGLLKSPLDSSGFMRWGLPGEGRIITVYTNPSHAYLVLNLNGKKYRFDTGLRGNGGKSRWSTTMRSSAGFVARHPRGY